MIATARHAVATRLPAGRRGWSPSNVAPAGRDAAPGREPIQRYDGSRLLSAYLVLLIFIPSDLVFPGLGAAGAPAMLFALFLFVRWVVAHIQGTTGGGSRLLRGTLIFFAVVILASYIAAQARVLTSLEANSADRGLLRLMGWSGVLLTALDGLPTRQALRRVLNTAGAGGVWLATLGLLQAMTGFDIVPYIHIPGLHPNNQDALLPTELRNGLPRVAATTAHPIEFATVMVLLIAIVAPLALRNRPTPQSRWWFVLLIAMCLAFPLAVARSGFVAAAALAIVVIPRLPSRPRRRALMALPFGLVAVHLAFPSLLGTVLDMFTYTADGQEVARTSDYPVVFHYLHGSPVIGYGFGTMINVLYRTLDNQFLGIMEDAGLLGLAAFIALHVTASVTAARARRLATTTDDKLMGDFLVGAPVAALVSAFTFDSLSFPMFAGIFFLVLGLCGGYASLMAQEAGATEYFAPRPRRKNTRLRYATTAGVAIIGAMVALQIRATPPTWVSSAAVVITPANYSSAIRFQGPVDTSKVATFLPAIITSDEVKASLVKRGFKAEYTIAQGAGSLKVGTDVLGVGPLLHIQTESHDPTQASATMGAVIEQIGTELADMQDQIHIAPSIQVIAEQTSKPAPPVAAYVGGKRMYAAILLLIGAGSWLAWSALERLLAWRWLRTFQSTRRSRESARGARRPAATRADAVTRSSKMAPTRR